MKKCFRYTIKTAYSTYRREVKDRLPYVTFVKILYTFFYKLAVAIIRENYEWKLGFMLGFIRIEKSKYGTFFWFWDRTEAHCRLPKRNFWKLDPADGRNKPYGNRGLKKWITECNINPRLPKYSVISKQRRYLNQK